jgi:hypothetical protein
VDTPKNERYREKGIGRCVMGTGKDKRYFDQEFKYEAVRLMNESKRFLRDIQQLDCPLISYSLN